MSDEHGELALDLTMDKLKLIQHDCAAMETFISQCNVICDGWNESKDKSVVMSVAGLLGLATHYLERAQARASRELLPVADFELGVRNTPYVNTSDLERFASQVDELFTWHSDEHPDYIVADRNGESYDSPSCAFIQSSGMGKTKLLYEYKRQREHAGLKILLIHCMDEWTAYHYTKPADTIYDEVLIVPSGRSDATRNALVRRMNEMKQGQQMNSSLRIVLLLDGANCLLADEEFPLRCIHMWLTLKTNTKSRPIAAVFVGTRTGLSSFYHEPFMGTTSRSGIDPYRHCGSQRFAPFVDLCTVGYSVHHDATYQQGRYETDMERAIPYGRPLFTILHQQGMLEEAIPGILQRMLLNETKWDENPASILSILATRVPMGGRRTVAHAVSDMVGQGYVNLTRCRPTQEHAAPRGTAQSYQLDYTHFTDPVCARLAMCLMDAQWTSVSPRFHARGRPPIFWTTQAQEIWRTTCRLDSDELGRMGAALYLLVCGDGLRRRVDPTYHTWAISWRAWRNALQNRSSMAWLETDIGDHDTISFVQLRQLQVPWPLEDVLSPTFLQNLYQSGTACCFDPGYSIFDMVASIQSGGGHVYQALLICVRTHLRVDHVQRELVAMQQASRHVRPTPVCMLVWFRDHDTDVETTYGTFHDGTLDDGPEPIVVEVFDDEFGVSNFVNAHCRERAESHNFRSWLDASTTAAHRALEPLPNEP